MITKDLFETYVKKDLVSGCWLWLGSVGKLGYGYVGGHDKAHRFSYELYKGPIPTGLYVLHKCDIKHCVNPDHLYTGTQADNIGDILARGSAWQIDLTRTECSRGHPLSGDNLRIVKGKGWRQCKTCNRNNLRDRRAFLREQNGKG